MARTIEFAQLMERLNEAFSANASEQWAEQNEQPIYYGPGIRPTTESYPDAEAALDTYIRETPPATP
ncbi:hypothetical protein [Nocardia phage KYD2]|nr:hypothetical protein [Nocardia phage KYD2]